MPKAIDITNSDSTQTHRRVSGLPPRRRGNNSVVAFPARPVASVPVSRGRRRNLDVDEFGGGDEEGLNAGCDEAHGVIAANNKPAEVVPGLLPGKAGLAERPNALVIVVPCESDIAGAAKALPDAVIVSPAAVIRETDFSLIVDRPVVIWPASGTNGFEVGSEVWNAISMAIDAVSNNEAGSEELIKQTKKRRLDMVRGIVMLPHDLPDGWVPGADPKTCGFDVLDGNGHARQPVDVIQSINLDDAIRYAQPCSGRSGAFAPMTICGRSEFKLTSQSIMKEITVKDGTSLVPIIDNKFEVLAKLTNKHGGGKGLQVRFQTYASAGDGSPDRQVWQEAKIFMGEVNGRSSIDLIANLTNKGLITSPDRHRDCLNFFSSLSSRRTFQTVSSPGWYGDKETPYKFFMLPSDQVFGKGAAFIRYEPPIVSKDKENKDAKMVDLQKEFSVKGRLEDWNREIGRKCVNNSRHTFAVSLAFLGPIMKPLGIKVGGLFHLVGEKGSGKSTIIHIASSVWGEPSERIKFWSTTGAAVEDTAVNASETFLALDEINIARPHHITSIVYKIGNGAGDTRADRSGNAKTTKSWTIAAISAGEDTLEKVLRTAGHAMKGGLERRCPSFPANAGAGMHTLECLHGMEHTLKNSFAFGSNMTKNADEFFGSPSKHYLKALAARMNDPVKREETLAFLTAKMDEFMQKYAKDMPHVKDIAIRFAQVAAAGELAISFGTLDWPEGEAMLGAGKCFKSWLEFNPAGSGSTDAQIAEEAVKDFLLRFGNSRFLSLKRAETAIGRNEEDGTDDFITKSGESLGFRNYVSTTGGMTTQYYIIPSAFEKIICKDVDFRLAINRLIEKGAMLRGDGKHVTQKKQLPGIGRTRVYVVDMDKLSATPDTSED